MQKSIPQMEALKHEKQQQNNKSNAIQIILWSTQNHQQGNDKEKKSHEHRISNIKHSNSISHLENEC